jgi:endonuclease YncB( thermonuclease family)
LHYCLPNDDRYLGTVTKVKDGDTLVVRHAGGDETIRLDGIDAPEMTQPHGSDAKKALSKLSGRDVTVAPKEKDRYGRTIARLRSGNGRDISEIMVLGGLAWHYKKYSDDKRLPKYELIARRDKRGLWADDKTPIAPWEWRKGLQPAKDTRATTNPAKSSKSKISRAEAARIRTENTKARSAPSPSVTSNSKKWITSSTGVRHNSGCRWYMKSNGSFGTGGRACKICGG